jgi:spore germination protein
VIAVKRWLAQNFSGIVFATALLVLGFAVGQYYLQKAYQQQMEASYRRAMREFAVHVAALSQDLGKARVVAAPEQMGALAASMRSSVQGAQASLGQLPLGEVDLGKVEGMLWQCYRSAYAYGAGQLSSGALQALYEQVSRLSQEVQAFLAEKEVESPWVSWNRYFTTSLVLSDSLTAALTQINSSLEELDEELGALPRRASGMITGDEIRPEQAREIAQAFSGRSDLKFEVINETEGDIPAYTVEAKGRDGESITVEVSQQGGLVLCMISSRAVRSRELEAGEMVEIARQFLAERDFPTVHMTDVQILQNRATITFVPVVGGVLRYAEPLKVQVSAADGEIIGFQGILYYLAQGRSPQSDAGEDEPQIAMEREEAEQRVSGEAVVLDHKLALVPNHLDETVLTHRLGVQVGDDYYLVYINDQSGVEEEIVQVSSPEFF